MPNTITPAPMIFIIVICSLKNKAANSITNIKLVPLNIYAVLSSIRFKICCQQIAYAPITPIAPHKPMQYCHDKNSCCAAYFVNNVTQAYSKLMPTNAPYLVTAFKATNGISALPIS